MVASFGPRSPNGSQCDPTGRPRYMPAPCTNVVSAPRCVGCSAEYFSYRLLGGPIEVEPCCFHFDRSRSNFATQADSGPSSPRLGANLVSKRPQLRPFLGQLWSMSVCSGPNYIGRSSAYPQAAKRLNFGGSRSKDDRHWPMFGRPWDNSSRFRAEVAGGGRNSVVSSWASRSAPAQQHVEQSWSSLPAQRRCASGTTSRRGTGGRLCATASSRESV